MKCVKIALGGAEYYLAFNGEAMFSVREKFGGADNMLEKVKTDTKEGFSELCSAIELLAAQGELARRYMGYEPYPFLTKEAIERLVMPTDIIILKLALTRAVTLGFGRDIEPENGEVDLVLAEINQKKTH